MLNSVLMSLFGLEGHLLISVPHPPHKLCFHSLSLYREREPMCSPRGEHRSLDTLPEYTLGTQTLSSAQQNMNVLIIA